MALPHTIEDWHKLESLTDFVAFLKILELDFLRDEERVARRQAAGEEWVEGKWAHPSLDGYFEQFGAYLTDHFLGAEDKQRLERWLPAVAAAYADPDADDPPLDEAWDRAEQERWSSPRPVERLDFRTIAWLMAGCRIYE